MTLPQADLSSGLACLELSCLHWIKECVSVLTFLSFELNTKCKLKIFYFVELTFLFLYKSVKL